MKTRIIYFIAEGMLWYFSALCVSVQIINIGRFYAWLISRWKMLPLTFFSSTPVLFIAVQTPTSACHCWVFFFLQLSLFSLTFCLASALATLLGVTGRYSILSSTPVLNTTLNSAAWMSELFTTPADGGMQQLNSGSCVSEQKQRWGCCAGLRARCKNEVCEKKAALGSWVKGKTQERRGGEIF